MSSNRGDELNLSREEENALNEAAKAVQQAGTKEALTIDLKELCKKYRDIKKYLEWVLAIVRRVPKYGEKIAGIVEFLMKLADVACPVPQGNR